ncbi:hypothetical protein PR048_024953 [Dryococelus australis]|uniref:Uncharacterized protein n=1 Tax=Dryococelus australis TaxID=614101 RepID=A0ABQ9GPZ7_9NEOP|nr:hypothetical protein PR048_024953 [Dryococelus australis]
MLTLALNNAAPRQATTMLPNWLTREKDSSYRPPSHVDVHFEHRGAAHEQRNDLMARIDSCDCQTWPACLLRGAIPAPARGSTSESTPNSRNSRSPRRRGGMSDVNVMDPALLTPGSLILVIWVDDPSRLLRENRPFTMSVSLAAYFSRIGYNPSRSGYNSFLIHGLARNVIITGVAPGFSRVGIMPDDAAGRPIFSEISRFPRLLIPLLLHTLSFHPHRLSKLHLHHCTWLRDSRVMCYEVRLQGGSLPCEPRYGLCSERAARYKGAAVPAPTGCAGRIGAACTGRGGGGAPGPGSKVPSHRGSLLTSVTSVDSGVPTRLGSLTAVPEVLDLHRQSTVELFSLDNSLVAEEELRRDQPEGQPNDAFPTRDSTFL